MQILFSSFNHFILTPDTDMQYFANDQNLDGNLLALLLDKKKQLPEVSYNFIKKETLAHVFSYEFCEISKNTFDMTSSHHVRILLCHER